VTLYLELRALQGNDPYKMASGPRDVRSANSASTSQGFGRKPDLCTRCWSSEHSWENCKATNCVACDARIPVGERCCPRWLTHSQPYRYFQDILPWERFKKSNGSKPYSHSNKRSHDDRPRDDKPNKALKPDASPPPTEKKNAKAARKRRQRNKSSEGAKED
jgi:hypothetical protein